MPTILSTYIDITPVSSGWQTIDISSHVPAGTAMVIVTATYNSGGQTFASRYAGDSSGYGGAGDPGLTQRINPSSTTGRMTHFVPVDGNRWIDIYTEDITKVGYIYLVGHFATEDVGIFSTKTEIDPTLTWLTTSYKDLDLSSDVPIGVDNIIMETPNHYSGGYFYIQPKGASVADLAYRRYHGNMNCLCMKLDASRVCSVKGTNSAYTQMWRIGYFKNTIGMKTDILDKTPALGGTWETVDVSGDAPASATHAIVRFCNVASPTAVYQYDIRKKGTTPQDLYLDGTTLRSDEIVELDGSDQFEVKVENVTNLKVYVVGYLETSIPANPNEFSGSAELPLPECASIAVPHGSMMTVGATFPLGIGASSFHPESAWIFPFLEIVGNGFWPDAVNCTLQLMELSMTGYNIQTEFSLEFEMWECSITAISGEVGVVETDIHIAEIDSVWYEVGSIEADLQLMECSGYLLTVRAMEIEASFELMDCSITMLTGEVLQVDIDFRPTTIFIPNMFDGEVTFHLWESDVELMSGETAFTNPLRLWPMTCSATLLSSKVYDFDLELPLMRSSITMITGEVMTNGAIGTQIGSVAHKMEIGMSLLGNGLTGQVGAITGEIELFETSGIFYMDNPADIEGILPLMRVQGFMFQTLEDNLTTYMVHLKSGAVTEVEYPFLEMAHDSQNYFGCNSNGLYVIGGDKFNNEDIDAFFTTGLLDFGVTNLKRLTDGYLTLKNAGTYKISLLTDDNAWNEYTMTVANSNSHTEKIQFGRGVKGKWWQIKFENQDGADFEIQSFEIITQTLRKKMRSR